MPRSAFRAAWLVLALGTKAARRLVALALLLGACGEQPGAPPATRPAARTQATTQVAALKDGPHTAEARKRVAELGSSDARAAAEAQQALMRLGRDAVPALV